MIPENMTCSQQAIKESKSPEEEKTPIMTCSQARLMTVLQEDTDDEKSKKGGLKMGASIQDRPAHGKLEKSLKSTGRTQENIAKAVGIHSSSLSRYKKDKGKGSRRPSFKTMKKLAKTIGQSPEQMFPELG